MAKKEPELPRELLVALRNPDIEIPGEQKALSDILRWMEYGHRQVVYREAEAVLGVDQFAWHAVVTNT